MLLSTSLCIFKNISHDIYAVSATTCLVTLLCLEELPVGPAAPLLSRSPKGKRGHSNKSSGHFNDYTAILDYNLNKWTYLAYSYYFDVWYSSTRQVII